MTVHVHGSAAKKPGFCPQNVPGCECYGREHAVSLEELARPIPVRPTEHKGARVRIVKCGTGNKSHEGKVGEVVDGSPEGGPLYVLVRLGKGDHCMATQVDDPEDQEEQPS